MVNCNYPNCCNTINSEYSCSIDYTSNDNVNSYNIESCPNSYNPCPRFNSCCYNTCHCYTPCCYCPTENLAPNENNLNEMEKEICYICQNQYDYFLNKPHVVGVGLGFKDIANYHTTMDSIIVYVDKKVGPNDLPSNLMIPSMYHGIPTDIVQTGGYFEDTRSLKDKIRPAIGGCSISPSTKLTSGTLACLVKDSKGIYILSNNHVLVNYNIIPIGTPIIQPGFSDGGTTPNDIIATLDRFVPILFPTPKKHPKNYVDCAIAKVTNPSLVSPIIASLGVSPQGITPPTLDIGVKKVGRTSGLTSGIVRSISSTLISSRDILYVDQIVATLISQSGDSGSLVLDANDKAVGLLRGATPENYSEINPIKKVLELLNVSLVIS